MSLTHHITSGSYHGDVTGFSRFMHSKDFRDSSFFFLSSSAYSSNLHFNKTIRAQATPTMQNALERNRVHLDTLLRTMPQFKRLLVCSLLKYSTSSSCSFFFNSCLDSFVSSEGRLDVCPRPFKRHIASVNIRRDTSNPVFYLAVKRLAFRKHLGD